MHDEVLLVPLPGHSRGHCGVAVRRTDDWLLHCGDAYFHCSEVEPDGGATPKGVRWFESLAAFNGAQQRANQERLRELASLALGEVKLICSHDMADFASMKNEARETRPAPTPLRPPRLDGALRGAARPAQQREARASRR
jgi:glyoxylase-like metal-dependent hydrolase (beta-lactamase superfamily II)